MTTDLISGTLEASRKWQSYFNQGDAEGCASMYEDDATMVVAPFGTFRGRQEIQGFWENIIAQGFSNVSYIDPELQQMDGVSVLLKSRWKMNKAHGVITRELWVAQDDGSIRLREDHFEVQNSD